MIRKRTMMTLAASALLLALAGCGGGGGGTPSADSNVVPDSAMQSPQGFIDYLLALTKKTDETSEPAAVGNGFSAPVDNAAEPVAIGAPG